MKFPVMIGRRRMEVKSKNRAKTKENKREKVFFWLCHDDDGSSMHVEF